MIARSLVLIVLMVMIPQGARTAHGQQDLERASIVSTDFCADQYVLEISPPSRILAVSPDAHSDYAFHRALAKDLPSQRPHTEILLSLAPQIVVRQWGGDASTMTALGQHNINTVQLGFVSDFAGINTNLEMLGTALDASDSARNAIERLEKSLMVLGEKHAMIPNLRALYVTPGGVTAGKGTMIDAIIKAAGLTNIASETGQSGWPALPAEALVMNPPDLIITGFFNDPLARANSWSPARHPVFQSMFEHIPTIHLPTDMISCAGPSAVQAAQFLQNAVLALDNTEAAP